MIHVTSNHAPLGMSDPARNVSLTCLQNGFSLQVKLMLKVLFYFILIQICFTKGTPTEDTQL